jgi:hypothetical protein
VEHIGIDVHKNQSQVCILTADAELIEKRIRTDRDRFTAVLGSRPRAKILIEASTESEWVARCLEAHGHEVIVADPNYAPTAAGGSRRTDGTRGLWRKRVGSRRTGRLIELRMIDDTYAVVWRSEKRWFRHGQNISLSYEPCYVEKVFESGPGLPRALSRELVNWRSPHS